MGGVQGTASSECGVSPGSFTVAPCKLVTASMTDIFGDGSNGNWLWLGPQLRFTLVETPANAMGTFTPSAADDFLACLPEGVYAPYACGGKWDNEVQ